LIRQKKKGKEGGGNEMEERVGKMVVVKVIKRLAAIVVKAW
jgi:hypothetical protein